ncbi:MAG: glycosyltransferase family 117 protein [Gemmatimonadaceae bacterium]
MASTTRAELDYRPSYLAAAITAAAILLLYLVTLSPSTAMWDASEYIAAAYVMGLPHPPGNPLFIILGRFFAILPIAPTIAQRINVLAALTGAISAGMWFLITERVLVSWLADRWQRIAGGAVAALIGATAFTVWNQSVVNEKVYTISLLGLAIISWLTVRWSDDPDAPGADRLLILVAYLLGLGYANHMMGFLAGPAVAVAVIMRRPQILMQWKLLLLCAGAVVLGMTPFLTQPIRSAFNPPINEGEPTSWQAFWDNFNRKQYGKPSVFERQAPLSGQIGMYWLYFRWQWFRDLDEQWRVVQQALAWLFMALGLLGAWVHWKRDRRSFWYFGTFMFTLTVLLVYYLNFKYGFSQNEATELSEVRDRDYFYLVSFSAWGVWAALGLVYLWEGFAHVIGAERVKVGKETVELPRRKSWMIATPILAIALIPLFANWSTASRAGHTDTADFAHDMLNSVEPYGVLVTVGDNDTFPLWYAQEVEGIRKDVVVANTSLLNTDWYVRQLIRRPVFEYDEAKGPAIYRGKEWKKPSGPPVSLTIEQANALPPYVEVRQSQIFRKGTLVATIQPQVLDKASVLVLRMIADAFPERPMYFARTSGSYGRQLGLEAYLLQQGLARKLLPSIPTANRDTVLLQGEGWFDTPRSRALWHEVFRGHKAIIARDNWADRASVGIPYLYISTAANLYEAEMLAGKREAAERVMVTAEAIARSTGLSSLFAQQRPTAPPTGDVPATVPLGADSPRR